MTGYAAFNVFDGEVSHGRIGADMVCLYMCMCTCLCLCMCVMHASVYICRYFNCVGSRLCFVCYIKCSLLFFQGIDSPTDVGQLSSFF